jgi:hypothetical protein
MKMKHDAKGLIYTILAGDKPIAALAANGREASELCKEKWFREELSALKSKGEPLYGTGVRLRARPAVESELVRYQELSDKAKASDEVLFVYLVDIDVQQHEKQIPGWLTIDVAGILPPLVIIRGRILDCPLSRT